MSAEQELLTKWRSLPQDKQEEVLDFVEFLRLKTSANKTPLGERLRQIRALIVADGEPLLSRDEIEKEIASRRGGQGYFILKVGAMWYNLARIQACASTSMSQPAIIEAFAELKDPRRKAGQRHNLTLCLALFTLAIAAGNKGFLAIGDWISSYNEQLINLFNPPKNRLPSYSTVRRALLHIDYQGYSTCLANFFNVQPSVGETIGLDGKVLKGSYQIENDNLNSDSHPAIMLVSAYIVERGLILEPCQVDAKTNEIKALPELIEKLALQGVVFAFDAINTQKKLVN